MVSGFLARQADGESLKMAAIVHESRDDAAKIRLLPCKSGLHLGPESGFCERLHDPGPCPGEIPAVISTTTGGDDPAFAVPVGQRTKLPGCQRMRLFCIAKMRNRVALQAVSPALQDDELRFPGIDECMHSFPGRFEFLITGAGWHWYVQLGALRLTLTRLAGGAGSRIEILAILVEIRKNDIGIALKTVKHTVAMMRVNIDIRDALQLVFLSQILDGNTTIIKYTKSGSVLTTRMM